MAGNKDAYQKAMNRGHSAAWDQEWEKAAAEYRAALKEFPNNPQALSSLGLALFEQQDYTAALQNYQKAASLAPDDPVPQEKIARIYERLGKLNEAVGASLQAAEMHLKARSADKAVDNWLRVLSLQPENTGVRTRLAAVYERTGKKDLAAAEYISLASIAQRSGDLTRAFKLVEYAHKTIPENQEVRLALSMLRGGQRLPLPTRPAGGTGPMHMARVREMEGAPDEESTGEAQDPISEARQRAMVQMAGLLFEQNDEIAAPTRSRGLSALTRGQGSGDAGESGDRNRIVLHVSQAIDSQSLGNNSQAVVELEHALSLGLRQPATYFNLGLLLRETDSDRAMRYLQQSVRHPDFSLASHLITAQLFEQSDQWAEAAGAYLQALALADAQLVDEKHSEELLSLYDALVDSVSTEDLAAQQAMCRSVASNLLRADWRAYLLKARANLPPQTAGMPPTPVAEMVLATRSGQVVDAMTQVRKLASSGKIHSALEEALYALQYAPNYMPLHVLIGELLLQEGRTSDAVQKFMIVAELHSVRGETARAVRMLRRISQLQPTDLTVRQRIIDMLVAQGKTEEALTEYTNLADLFYRLADLEKARQVYLDALKLAQKSTENRSWGVDILMKVADIDMQRLNLRQALRVYEQVRTIQPDNAEVRSQIVDLNFRLSQEQVAMKEMDDYIAYLENGGKHTAALQFVTTVLEENSGRLDVRRRLADLYLKRGQTDQAIIQLDAAADALLTSGKHYEAINLLETIVSLNPPNVQEYKSALESLRREMLRK